MLVLGATVLGARLAAAGDDRVEYWAVGDGATPGDTVSRDDLRAVEVRLPEGAAGNYIRTDETFDAPLEDLVWAHRLTSGSLVGRDALVSRSSTPRGELPLSVAQGAAPSDLAHGDVVDVWVGPGPGDDSGGPAVRVLEGVRVLRTGGDAVAAGGSLARTVLVDVDQDRLGTEVVSAVATGHVTLVRIV
ncbi:hypothetical protein AERO_10365 [Aeromicrobium fastidiosum]|nr:hypothetical protein [Aeromicrobium fastidiosum]KQX72452.1 hypothetical protein ASD10_15805 [Aeromicrobium sp. Root472D3]MCL8251788.1 hypothetical protein [Aeromicrobium fastidiosum]